MNKTITTGTLYAVNRSSKERAFEQKEKVHKHFPVSR